VRNLHRLSVELAMRGRSIGVDRDVDRLENNEVLFDV
jgi:hypothetical protein